MPSKAFRQIYKTKICEKLEWASIFEKFVGHAIYISENLRLEKTFESLIGRGFRGFPFKHYLCVQGGDVSADGEAVLTPALDFSAGYATHTRPTILVVHFSCFFVLFRVFRGQCFSYFTLRA